MVAPAKRISFDDSAEGANVKTLFDANGGGGSMTAKAASQIRGKMGCEVSGSSASSFGTLNYAASTSTAGAQMYFSIGTAPTAADDVILIRDAATTYANVRISTGNVLTVADAGGTNRYTSTTALASGNYVVTVVIVKGTTTSNGRMLVWLRDNSKVLVSSGTAQPVDTGATINTGIADYTICRFGKTTGTGTHTFNIDECATSEGSVLEIDSVNFSAPPIPPARRLLGILGR